LYFKSASVVLIVIGAGKTWDAIFNFLHFIVVVSNNLSLIHQRTILQMMDLLYER
jgi:hypothetical protein